MNMLLMGVALALAAMDPEHVHEHSPQLGRLTFETTCRPEAQAQFEQGVGWLHSFEYRRAEQTFRQAVVIDPDCGIADGHRNELLPSALGRPNARGAGEGQGRHR